jgi:alanine racemase
VLPGGLRPTWAEVDLDRLEANARRAAERAGDRPTLAVVKADGYGHGALASCRAFAAGGVTSFAVALLEEAQELRRGGVREPLLLLGPLLPSQLAGAAEAGAAISVYTPEMADALEEAGRRRGTALAFHLKLDSGMGRLGVPVRELGAFLDHLRDLDHVRMEGIFTHLACGDDPDDPLTPRQVEAFRDALGAVREAGHRPAQVHLANSAALLRGFPDFCNLVRPGLALYGYSPGPERIPAEGFLPALSVLSRVAQVKRVPPGTSIGYGATWVAPRESVIATVPMGYEDGYMRALGNRAQVLVAGRRAPVVGRISMDLTTLDVTDLPSVAVGDLVTLLGRNGDEQVDAWELARRADTVAWEILCGIGRRVPRLYVRDGRAVVLRSALADPGPGAA